MKTYTPVIGLEVHVELKTKSKMFCGCSTEYFGKEPNTHTCPVCLGLPGALPVPNKLAVQWCIKIALALSCKINEYSKFDRKNYFYPDLAKGYQISQYDLPFGFEGLVKLNSGKTIRIRRVHMEEDTGKLSHQKLNGRKISLIDFNRSGIPLVEIVTEPDFRNAFEVKEYLENLQQIVRYLDVSNADMEKGEMRLEPNVSLTTDIKELPDYKVEVKNINSFKFVEKAVNFEIARQKEKLEKREKPKQETRGWNEDQQKTFSQRSKENAHDYRYFPEPDIPPIVTAKNEIKKMLSTLPELPKEKQKRFEKEYNLSSYDAKILIRDMTLANYFETITKLSKRTIDAKTIANWIINKKVDHRKIAPEELLSQIISTKQTVAIDENKLEKIINAVIKENEKAVNDYKKGIEQSLMFLLGQVMKKIGKKADPQIVLKKIKQQLI